jgi:hypothetical protein
MEDSIIFSAFAGIAMFTGWVIRTLMIRFEECVKKNTEAINNLSIIITLCPKRKI